MKSGLAGLFMLGSSFGVGPSCAQKFLETVAPAGNPKADAAKAIAAGDFRLIVAGQYVGLPLGVTCFTPDGRPNGELSRYQHGDAITPILAAQLKYIRDYNVAIVESAAYPDSDICRVARDNDPRMNFGAPLVSKPVALVIGPVRSLYEAARRGDAADVRRLLSVSPARTIDKVDGTGMTALAWAVARGNKPVVDELLLRGADPWAGEAPNSHSAVYWAAATGRADDFDRLTRGAKPNWWQNWAHPYLAAAVYSGNAEIVRTMILAGYEPIVASAFLVRGPPPAAAVEPLLREKVPGLADAALFTALRPWNTNNIPIDLVRVALQSGASPNATHEYGETALGLVSHAYYVGSLEAVDLLLAAGADPNLQSPEVPVNPQRPFWIAVGTMSLITARGATYDRAFAIAKRLLAAGANLKLTNNQEKPPIWFLLTPMRGGGREEQVADSPALVELIPVLVRMGVNPNAKWRGKKIFPLVRLQLGDASTLAQALKSAGAR